LLERRIPRLYARAQLADLIERGVQARMEQEIARAKQLNADQAAGLASAEPTEAVPLDEIAAELADDPTDPE
jgi:hypothetical protein